MGKLIDKKSLSSLDEEIDEKIDIEKQKELNDKIDALVKKGNKYLICENYNKAKENFYNALELQHDNSFALIGLIKAISNDFSIIDDDKVDEYIDTLLENNKNSIDDSKLSSYIKRRNEYLEDHPKNGIFSKKKIKELLSQYENKKAYSSIQYYADREDIDMMAILASWYFKGIIVNKDMDQAIAYYNKLFKLGYIDAAFILGNYYRDNLYSGNPEGSKAYNWYIKGKDANQIDCKKIIENIDLKHKKEEEEEFKKYYYWVLPEDELNKKINKGDIDDIVIKSMQYYIDKKKKYEYCYMVGYCYHNGIGIDKNYDLAFKYLEQAIKAFPNDYEALYLYSYCKRFGQGTKEDNGLAMQGFKKCAENNQKDAMHYLADNMYERDPTCFKDYFDIYQRLSALGDEKDIITFAKCYSNGIVVKKDINKAIEILEKSKNKGADTYFELAELYVSNNNDKKAFDNYLSSYKKGNTRSKYKLAIAYKYGKGVSANSNSYKKYASESADAKDSDGIKEYVSILEKEKKYEIAFDYFDIGYSQYHDNYFMFKKALYLYEGIGIEKNIDEATRCFEIVEKDKNNNNLKAKAKFYLGKTYFDDAKYEKAYPYFVSSYELKYNDALAYQAKCIENGVKDSTVKQSAFDMYFIAYSNGSTIAGYFLGLCYKYGKGIKENDKEAFSFIKEAFENGCEEARHELASLYKNGIGTDKDLLKAIDLLIPVSKNNNEIIAQISDLYGKLGDVENHSKWIKKIKSASDSTSLNTLAKEAEKNKNIKKAYSLYEESANINDPYAKYKLGELYFEYCLNDSYKKLKSPIIKNVEEESVFNNLLYSFSKGTKIAARYLGLCYLYAIGCSKNNNKGINLLSEAIKNGDTTANYDLGLAYYNGTIGSSSNACCLDYFKKAINGGNNKALLILGEIYSKGDIINIDYSLAFKYYESAYSKEITDALDPLIDISKNHLHDNEKAIYYCIEKYNHTGDSDLIPQIIDLYSCLNNNEQVIKWINIGIEHNNGYAYYKKAVLEENGQILNKDINKALEDYTQSAKLNNLDAMVKLIDLYKNDFKVDGKPNYINIYQLSEKLLSKNYKVPYKELGYIFKNGLADVKKDINIAFKYYKKAYDIMIENKTTDLDVIYNLAKLYEDYNNNQCSLYRAKELYLKGLDLHSGNCCFEMGSKEFYEIQESRNQRRLTLIKNSIKYFEDAIQYGCDFDDVYLRLGQSLEYCYDPKYNSKIQTLYEEAYKRNVVEADYYLGRFYYKTEQYDNIIPVLKNYSNDKNKTDVIFFLACAYEKGKNKNLDKAFELYKIVSDNYKHLDVSYLASFNYKLSQFYKYGWVTQKNEEIYVKYLKAAINNYDIKAVAEYADLILSSKKKTLYSNVFNLLCENTKNLKNEEMYIFYPLGLCYLYGYGTFKMRDKAFPYIKAAALKGERTDSFYELALCYDKGYGVKKNKKEAYNYYTKYVNATPEKTKKKVKASKRVKKLKKKFG